MARVTVEDCLDHVDNRFELVLVASKRARQLARQGMEPTVEWDNDKPTVVALREIAVGHVTKEILKQREQDYQTSSLDLALSTNSLNLEGFLSNYSCFYKKPSFLCDGFLFGFFIFKNILAKAIIFIEKKIHFFKRKN